MTEEIRSVSSTGAEKGVKLARYSLLPAQAIREVAEHYGRGSLKYADNNWRRGYEWSKSLDALTRHLFQFWGGEDIDEETGSKHIIAVAWHALALATFMDEHPEFDDRFKPVGEIVDSEVVDEEDPETTEEPLALKLGSPVQDYINTLQKLTNYRSPVHNRYGLY